MRFRWTILCLVGLVACSRGEPQAPGSTVDFMAAGRPSILLITLDTTRADHLEPYGAEDVETPALSRLADNGIVFEHAVATTPVTQTVMCLNHAHSQCPTIGSH